ncbi:MAG: aminoacyl-tRNA hydrolase [Deltaproteobacteria bacterium]|nr:aminoacyl-tRNA hydrolase [Deltaproteobacteria bacterium]
MVEQLFAVVGLGNPGRKYADTRHNVGAWVVEALAALVEGRGEKVVWRQKFNCNLANISLAGHKVILVLPQVFMNQSGAPVAAVCGFFKIDYSQLIIIHDDLDFAPGVVRIKQGGSSGGHRGVEDVMRHLGRGDFCRLRVGIGHPERQPNSGGEVSGAKKVVDVKDWVLSAPSREERMLLSDAVCRATDATCCIIEMGVLAAQQRLHAR